ncbi:MAG: hypothetical protein Q9182_006330 [Xanthomendoza sp. 2 TL-2023]
MAPGSFVDPRYGNTKGHINGDYRLHGNAEEATTHGATTGDIGEAAPPLSHPPHSNINIGRPTDNNGISDEISVPPVEPVAIIGMAMRLPGGVHDAESFWDLLINRRDGQCRVPFNRYNIDAWYGPGKSGHVGTQYGYFLEDLNLAHMDASFWSMTKSEAEAMDPQQRLLLEVVYECLENSGTKDWRGNPIGCYVGIFGEDWLDMDGKETQNSNMYRVTGYGDYITANRVSYEFDFKGPR